MTDADEAQRVVRACLEDWDEETADVERLDVERCLQLAGFQLIRENSAVRVWRNPQSGRQYLIMQRSLWVAPRVVQYIRDTLKQDLGL